MENSNFENGFAQIEENDQKYLVDRFSGKWRLATEIKDIQADTEAIVLTGRPHQNVVPPDVFLPEKLVVLSLTRYGFGALPAKIAGLQHLRFLLLRQNQLRALPPEIGALKNLVRLDLTENYLTDTLPAEIAQLKYLMRLEIGSNRLTGLPLEIGALTNLRTLDLRGTPIEKVHQLRWLLPGCDIKI